jgi:hypothetical protein
MCHLKLTRADGGEEILHGSFSELMTMIPGSTPRLTAEQAIARANIMRAREQLLAIRVDAIEQREHMVTEREQKALADGIRKFVDKVAEVGRRLDSLEEQRNRAALAALPDPDACNDFLPQAPIEPSAEEDRKQLMEVEEAISEDDTLELKHGSDDLDLGIPAASLSPIMGKRFEGNELPEGTQFPVKHDSSHVCRRDAKAARKRMRSR